MHLPEKNFKMIRYGGFYASKCKSRIHAKKFKHKPISKSLSLMDWRNSILKSFGYDPLICAKCGSEMHFAALYFQFKKYRWKNSIGRPSLKSETKRIVSLQTKPLYIRK